ncbi:MAG: radical SAM protein [archaeon]
MRILFINCVSKTDFTYSVPLATGYLASYLKGKFKEKLYVKAVSIADKDKLLQIVKEYKPDIVGLTVTTPGYDYAKELSKSIRKLDKKVVIVAGGAHITLFPDAIIPEIDYAVAGEGEQTFHELLKYLYPKISIGKPPKTKKEIDGLIFWENKKLHINKPREFIKDLDSVGLPERALLNPTNNTLFTSRGCPYNCIYCSSPIIWRRTFRMHSVEYILEDIKRLYSLKHSVQWFGDDLFICNKQRIRDLIQLMKKEKLLGKISFIALGRSNLIDEEMIKLLKELNVLVIHFGFETGDNEILQYAKNSKAISVEQNKKASDLCRKYGILVQGYAMMGFPQDTHETIMNSFNFFKKYSDLMDTPNMLMVFPKTALCEELKQKTGKDYSKIHLEKIKLSFGGSMPVTNETILCDNVTPKEFDMYKKKFHDAGKIKNKIFYTKLFTKLVFSKGFFLNMYYLYNIFITSLRNPRREHISETVEL